MREFDELDLGIIRELIEGGMTKREAEAEVLALREPFPMDASRVPSTRANK